MKQQVIGSSVFRKPARFSAGLFIAAAFQLLPVFQTGLGAEEPALPKFVSGQGITVLKTAWREGSDRTVIVDIKTPLISENAINGGVNQVWITLPKSYFSEKNAEARYPVLYLLHGGAGGWAGQWVTGGGTAEDQTAGRDVITVMPDGGKVGWFTDWVGDKTQQWKTFHLNQLVPWIDANLRTNAVKNGRAIAGLSMGGYGAFHYAFVRPDLFAYAGSFSGAVDVEETGTQLVIWQQSQSNGLPSYGAFGDTDSSNWSVNNPIDNVEKFRGVYLDMYAGSGTSDFDVLERTMGQSNFRMHKALDKAGIENSFVMYGRPGGETGCDGGHNFGCWNYALSMALPKIMTTISGTGIQPVTDEDSTPVARGVRLAPETGVSEASVKTVDWDGRGASLKGYGERI